MMIPVSSQPPTTHSLNQLTSTHPTATTGCLLKTAITDVCAGIHYCNINILLDEGAQKSFISQKLAND